MRCRRDIKVRWHLARLFMNNLEVPPQRVAVILDGTEPQLALSEGEQLLS